MAGKKVPHIQADSVGKTACHKCGHVVDVSDKQAFAIVDCPACGARFATPGQLGQFVLLKALGAGGMGATYKAYEKALDRHVAIKILHAPRQGESHRHVDRFFSEARALASLDHPNVARAYSVGEAKGQPFLVMELIEGNALDQLFKVNAPLDEAMTLAIGAQVARALQAANTIGLIHSDVKPANILVDAEGNAKLVDFGIARFGGGRMTRADALGTPYYLSPEQVRRQTLDFRTDIYSLGATLFHAMTGATPFEGDRAKDQLVARLKQPAPDLLAVNQDLQATTADVVARMMKTDPNERYGNYDELIWDLDAAAAAARSGERHAPSPLSAHELSVPAFADNRPFPDQSPLASTAVRPRRRIPLIAGILVAALAAAGGGLWLVSQGGAGDGNGDSPPATRDVPPAPAGSQVARPILTPPPGPISKVTTVAVTCPTEGAVIRYTLDRTEPHERSSILSKSLVVQPGMFFRIRAFREGYTPSDTVNAHFEHKVVDTSALEPLRARAGEAWQRVRDQDRGGGVGEMLDKCSLLVVRGERHYQGDEAAAATATWKELIALCKTIDERVARRTAAVEARKAAEKTRGEMGNPKKKGPGFAAYAQESQAAAAAFNEGKFADAVRLWNSAKGHIQDEGRKIIDSAKAAYQAAREKFDAEGWQELEMYGGNDWRQFSRALTDARKDQGTPVQIADKYRRALALLPKVEATAKKGAAAAAAKAQAAAEAAAKREREIAVVRDAAVKLFDAKDYFAALAKAKAALVMKPSDGKTQALIRRIEGKLKLTVQLDDETSLTLVLIKPGSFTMGSPEDEKDRFDNETAQEVELTKAFYMSTHEITVAQWTAFVEGSKPKYRTMAERGDGAHVFIGSGDKGRFERKKDANWRNCGFAQDPKHPVTCVTWYDATKACAWLTAKAGMTVRLPTEAEWEYACRAGQTKRWGFGDNEGHMRQFANVADRRSDVKERHGGLDDGVKWTAPVGKYKPNAWGLYDMHGNVAEWCIDGGLTLMGKGVLKDPRGRARNPAIRGGAWGSHPRACRSAFRWQATKAVRISGVGFRVVAEP